MFFGTFIGSLADRLGRKRFCLLYTGLYILSCLTKHFKIFSVLIIGRLLGGIATSLLFSVFDAWMVSEHNKRNYDNDWLSDTFSSASFGNSIVAILSGIIAQAAADMKPLTPLSEGSMIMIGGFCTPFDLAIIALSIGSFILNGSWPENFGMSDENSESSIEKGLGASPSSKNTDLTFANLIDMQGLKKGVELLKTDYEILICGLLQSLFEGSMYIFVFMWTPALSGQNGHSSGEEESEPAEEPVEEPPYGRMFATFMLCCMCGSSLFSVFSKIYTPDGLLLRIFLVSSFSLAVPVFSSSEHHAYMAFLLFEICVGMYFPAMGTMKSSIVPESSRAALYNLFRVPLNFIVVGVLLSDMSTTVAFSWSSSLLLFGTILQFVLIKRLELKREDKESDLMTIRESSLDDLLGKSRDNENKDLDDE